jgi:phage gpG-like protein
VAKKSGTLIQRSRRVSAAEKAAYHELTGAGKSRVKRPFFGLDEKDEAAIMARIDQGIQAALGKAG